VYGDHGNNDRKVSERQGIGKLRRKRKWNGIPRRKRDINGKPCGRRRKSRI
jgi:hypothetical protein